MRIIAGRYKGHQLKSPSGHHTHPMSEIARGALFNILGDIQDLDICDIFAGTGAISTEAISRGAKHTTLVENDRKALECIEHNTKSLNISGKFSVIKQNAYTWVNETKNHYDIVICDPPYQELKIEKLWLFAKLLHKNSILIFSLPEKLQFEVPKNLTLLQDKTYAGLRLLFIKQAE